MTAGKEKARGNGQVTTGPESSTDSRQHSATAAAIKPQGILANADRFRPQAEHAGRQLIRSWVDYGPKDANTIDPDTMPGILAEVGKGVLDAMLREGLKDFSGVLGYFTGAPEGISSEFIECCQGNGPRPESCGPLLKVIQQWHREHRKDMLAARLRSALDNGDATEAIVREFVALDTEAAVGIADMLAARAFDFTAQPPRPVPLFRLADMPLCTPGNVTNIQAAPKAGKSAVVDAMLAAVMNGNRQGPDTLGFSAENSQGHALLHIDTEQSRFDADALVRRAIRRAMLTEPPPWFHSYALADLGIRERREALRHVMSEAMAKHGGIFAVLIDGIGDLCGDPNDSEESFELVHELHALAIRNHCTIATVLHENPGTENGKTRGHLGSQLERKAETNLRLSKDAAGVTTIWAERARHCYLPKEQGPCFVWNDDKRMHLSCGTAGEMKQAANRERFQSDAEAAFGTVESLRHSDLLEAVCVAFDLKERAAKERVRKWAMEGIIRKDASGKYHLANP